MTKEEFINKLKKKISMLEQSEIDDIISEYEGFIDEKMASGMSEKEAVKSLGNVDEIANDLKSAYKINNDYGQSNAKNFVEEAIDKLMKGLDVIIKSFENKSASDVIVMIVKVFLLVIAIRICKFPVDILLSIAEETFLFLGETLGYFLFHIFSFFINVIYVILALLVFYKITKDKIIGEDVINEIKEKDKEKDKKETKKEDKVVEEKKSDSKKEVVLPPAKEQPKRKGFFDVCSEIVLIFIKFIVFWIAFADLFFIVGMSSALAIAIYLIAKGVTYFGPALILLALTMGGITFLEVFIRFVFNSKQRVVKFLITLILSLIIGGAGIGIFSLEIANTTIIEEIPQDKLEVVKEEYKMEKNLVISDHLFTEYVVDNKLKDKIIIEYTYYDDYFEFKPETYINRSTDYKIYHMNYSASWNTNSFRNLIRDLKKKEIYNVSDIVRVKVITSKDNIKILERNHEDYYTREVLEDNMDDIEDVDLDELDEDDIGSIGE